MRSVDKYALVYSRRSRIATIITCIIIGIIFSMYLASTRARIDEYAKQTLENQHKMASISIDARLNDARRSITSAAGEVSAAWSEDESHSVVSLVAAIKRKYIFDVLEFVDKDGINLMSGDNRFDASDREYYKEGIKGNSGLWVNYNPKESKEFLLDFYSPVYYQGDIVGILVGALGSKASLDPLTESYYFGRESIGVLYNEDERAIAASFGVDGELYSSDIYEMFNLTAKDKEIFSRHVKSKDGQVFTYEGDMGNGIACAGEIDEKNWGLIMIMPSDTFSSVYGDFTNSQIMTLGLIAIVVCIYILFILRLNMYRYTEMIKENEDIIKGFSTVYHSVFMIDYTEGVARCIRTRDPVTSKYGIKEGETVSIKEEFLSYLLAIADDESAKMLSAMEHVMYIKTMMDGKEFFNIEFNQALGGKGSIAIANLKPEKSVNSNIDKNDKQSDIKETNERYLLGITELS